MGAAGLRQANSFIAPDTPMQLLPVLGINPDRDGAVIDQFYEHMRAEYSAVDGFF